jgi:ankyrin repeat protein
MIHEVTMTDDYLPARRFLRMLIRLGGAIALVTFCSSCERSSSPTGIAKAIVRSDVAAISENAAEVLAAAVVPIPEGLPENVSLRLEMYLPDGERSTSPLGLAVAAGHSEVVQALIAMGLDVNSALHPEDPIGRTPLMLAAGENQAEVVSLLLAAGADPGRVTSEGGYTALSYALRFRATEAARILAAPTFSKLGKAHVSLGTGGDPVSLAASFSKDPDLLRLLIDVGFPCDDGHALRNAAQHRQLEAVRILAAAGSPLDTPGVDGETAMSYAALRDQPAVMVLLADLGVPLDQEHPHGSGRSLLWWAIEGASPNAAKVLLDRGVPIRQADLDQLTVRERWFHPMTEEASSLALIRTMIAARRPRSDS